MVKEKGNMKESSTGKIKILHVSLMYVKALQKSSITILLKNL